VRDALQRYETQLVNMYKVRDGQTQCPDCDGSGVDQEDGGDCPSCDGKGTINNADRANDAVTHTQPQHHGTIDHRQLMDRLYAEHDAELSNAWRSK
jgi:RecJ-like exonuclease